MQRIAVVTGANKGIGYEIAKQLLTTCTVVVLACRNKELGEAAHVPATMTTGGEVWKCRVRASDGIEFSAEVEAQTTIVAGEAP